MNFKQLEAFYWLSQIQNYRQTAQRLGLTQPAVSARIQSLENDLGKTLIDRTAPSFRLTDQGIEVADFALQFLNLRETMNTRLLDKHKQRLAIGQALVAEPRILLLDEPFGALDPGTRLSMHDFLTELRERTNMTVFMVTHDIEEAFKLGDRVLIFDKVRRDPERPQRFGATITHDLDSSNGHEPHQELLDSIPWLSGLTQLSDEDDGPTVQAAGPLARDDAKARNEPPL